MRRYWIRVEALFVVGCALLLPACAAPDEPFTRANRSSILGGEGVPPGAWPMVVWLDNGCTGLLLAENIVAFPAHCGSNVASAWLGDALDVSIDDDAGTARVVGGAGAREIRARRCVVHPDFQLGTPTDVAFCELEAAAIAQSQVIRPALGCARAAVEPGASVTLVGFGRSSADDPPGLKRAAVASVTSTGASFEIGDTTHGTCAGDSGSPAFVRVGNAERSEWAVAGILSGGVSGEACGGGYYVDLASSRDWLERTSGIDLSPCFDDGAAWAPSAACTKPTIDEAGLVTPTRPEPDALCGPSFLDLKTGASSDPGQTSSRGCAVSAARASRGVAAWLALLTLVLALSLRWRARIAARSARQLTCTDSRTR